MREGARQKNLAFMPPSISQDDLIDVVVGNRVYLPCLYCYNKCDLVSVEDMDMYARRPHSVVAR